MILTEQERREEKAAQDRKKGQKVVAFCLTELIKQRYLWTSPKTFFTLSTNSPDWTDL